jgi:hypothetical protein
MSRDGYVVVQMWDHNHPPAWLANWPLIRNTIVGLRVPDTYVVGLQAADQVAELSRQAKRRVADGEGSR